MKTVRFFACRICIAVLLLLTLLPFYLLVINSFKISREIVLNPFTISLTPVVSTYQAAFSYIVQPIFNTLIVTACVICGTLILTILASFAFVRFEFWGKELIYYLIIAMLMIPGFVVLVPQFIQMVNWGFYDTYLGLILPPMAHNVALGTFLMRKSMSGLPKTLFEAAEIEGATDRKILKSIAVPLSVPIIATVAITTGLSAWNNYIWPLVISSSDRTTQISVALTVMPTSIELGNGALFAGYVMASLPLLVLFCFTSKYFIAGLTQGSVKG